MKTLLKHWYRVILDLPLLVMNRLVLSDSANPFPSITTPDGDIVKAVGTYMETGMKYALIGG